MNRCDVGSDGKTPLQRLHGRRDNTPVLEFGEKILYMPAKPARGGQWEPRFHPGVFVGMLNSSSEAVVVTEQGTANKTRSANVRRIPESEMGRGQSTRNASRPMVPGWQRQCIRHSSRNGENRGDDAPSPRRGADGEPGSEDLPSQGRLRAVGSQQGLPWMQAPENWSGTAASSQRSMSEED